MKELLKGPFPVVIADGFCGKGKANTVRHDVPYFFSSTFENETPLYFQPEIYAPLTIESHPFHTPELVHTKTEPSEDIFTKSIEVFKQDPRLKKIVLARKRTHTFSDTLPCLEILSQLFSLFPQENVFAFIENENTMFFGVTPENLYKKNGRTITVDCIAGTVSKDSSDDLFSPKMKEELQIVTDYVSAKLTPLVARVKVSTIGTKDAGNLTHLYQTVKGDLLSHANDLSVIEALHPTPATLGFPKNEAFEFLSHHEPFKRGLYAGALGWIGETSSTVKVCLRCGEIQKNTLCLFAGAGIVKDSIAEKELEEINHKFNTLEGVILEAAMSN